MYLYEKHKVDHVIQNPTLKTPKPENIQEVIEAEKRADFFRHENQHYITMMSSMAHTYGNVLAFMQNVILDLFPKGLFKTIHVNSKIAHRQMRSTGHEFLKKNRPMIIFRPRIADYDEDYFLKGTCLADPQTDVYATYGNTSLRDFLTDPKHNFRVKYQQNRSVMYIDVILVFSTLMQQINYVHTLRNEIRWNKPRTIPTCLESFIPQEMLSLVSQIINVPMYDNHGSTKEFLTYLQGISCYPITYMFEGGTGTREFYRYHKSNIEAIFSNFSWDEGEAVDHIMEKYQINFTVRVEFYSTGFYFFYHDKIYDLKLPEIPPEKADIIPVYTDVFTKEDLNLRQGWQLYNRASCKIAHPFDEICIAELLNESILTTIRYYVSNGMPLSDFLDFRIRRHGTLIHEGQHYHLDLDTMTVKFLNQNTNFTYQFIICVNVELINNITKYILENQYKKEKIIK